MTKISIVTTLYKSESYIKEFYIRSLKSIEKIGADYEFIFVSDGSPDQSLQEAINLYEMDRRVKVIELSRNFGHHKAIMAGLSQACGDYVFLIDVDLEESPELLETFWNELQKKENQEMDVLYGVQGNKRKGGLIEQWSGKLFYKTFNFLVDEKDASIPTNFLTVRLMKKAYVQALLTMQEKDFYFAPSSSYIGFNQKAVTVTKQNTSPTTYNFFKRYMLFINSILSFTSTPLFFIFYFGLTMTIVSFLVGSYFLSRKIFFHVSMEGWTSIIVSIWFLAGVIICFLGIISLYLYKMLLETKNRPSSIIRNTYQHSKEGIPGEVE